MHCVPQLGRRTMQSRSLLPSTVILRCPASSRTRLRAYCPSFLLNLTAQATPYPLFGCPVPIADVLVLSARRFSLMPMATVMAKPRLMAKRSALLSRPHLPALPSLLRTGQISQLLVLARAHSGRTSPTRCSTRMLRSRPHPPIIRQAGRASPPSGDPRLTAPLPNLLHAQQSLLFRLPPNLRSRSRQSLASSSLMRHSSTSGMTPSSIPSLQTGRTSSLHSSRPYPASRAMASPSAGWSLSSVSWLLHHHHQPRPKKPPRRPQELALAHRHRVPH